MNPIFSYSINNSVKLVLLIFFIGFIGCNSNSIREYKSEVLPHFSENTTFLDEGTLLYFPDTLNPEKGNSISIASWNIQHLGRTKTAEDVFEIANVLRDFDLVAIQEVVAKDPAGAQAVARIADELNRMGSKWDYQVSDPTKSPSVYSSERYAFLWKTSKINIVHRAFLDTDLEDLCFREPFVAAFKTKKDSELFYVVNYHSRKYNDKPEEEILHFIDYPKRLDSNRIIIAGDFNLSETHEVWKPFYQKGSRSALQATRTTLKWNCKNGDYLSHPIDNFYFTSGITSNYSGSIDIVGHCDNLKRVREISDHLPVFMKFKISGNDNAEVYLKNSN
jgi:endonuclease/exonuclease/phosphatase family metal-dependent hydrolase